MKMYLFFLLCIFYSLFLNGQKIKEKINEELLNFLNNKDKFKESVPSEGYKLGYIPSSFLPDFKPYLKKTKVKHKSLPDVYDLRTLGLVTPVKNQGNCGSCWAHATMGAIESHWLKLGLGTYDLSEQNLRTCHGFLSPSCEGGNEQMATAYLSRIDGPILEVNDPYNTDPNAICNTGLIPVRIEHQARFIPADMDLIKQKLMEYGAIYACMYWSDSYYNPNNNTYYCPETQNSNHSVLIVGWDNNKVTAGGTGAWIVKNSWGTTWGENGYFYISYNDANFPKCVTFWPQYLDYNQDIQIQHYDRFGAITYISYGTTSCYSLTKFILQGDNRSISKLATYITTASTSVKFEIYDTKIGNILSDLLTSTPDFYCEFPGYYTFDLNDLLPCTDGNDIYVKVKYSVPSGSAAIPIERAIANYVDPVIETGVCWVSSNGSTWMQIGQGTSYPFDLTTRIITVTTPPIAEFTASSTLICKNESVNFIDQSINNPTSWSWQFPGATPSVSTQQNPTNIVYNNVGTFSVTLTVSNSAGSNTKTKTNYITVLESINPSIKITASKNPICTGESVTFSASIVGGGSNPTFTWKKNGVVVGNNSPSYTTNNLADGDVIICILTSSSPCVTNNPVSSNSIVMTVNPLPMATASNTGPYCAGATIQLNSGPGGLSYSWSGPAGFTSNQQNPTRTNSTTAMAGVYTVTVTNTATSCSSTASTTVIVNSLPAATASNTGSYCVGSTIQLNSGPNGMSYSWSGPANFSSTQQNPKRTNCTTAMSGIYTVTVTNTTTSCSATATTNVIVNSLPSYSITKSDVTCYGLNNGTATVNHNESGYTYNWSNGQTSKTISNLVPGTYTVTVTNSYNCSSSASVTISQPAAININITTTMCDPGQNNGTATANVSGGVPPYSYAWSTNPIQTTQTATNLSAGIYIVTVTDNNNCTKTAIANIIEYGSLVINVTNIKNVSCYGGNDGSISISVTGGQSPYTYLWSTGQNTSTISNLVAGTYTVTVTDNSGQTASSTYTITQPDEITITHNLSYYTNSCGYVTHVNINITVSGGNLPYTYIWSTGSTNEDITVSNSGTYTVTVRDANNCTRTHNIVVDITPSIMVNAIKGDVSCKGNCDGYINLMVNGGTPPYTYKWVGPSGYSSTSEDLANLCKGYYYVTITDNTGCKVQRSFSIAEPSALSASFTTVIQPTCTSKGALKVTAAGGTPPYSYIWNGPTCPCSGNYITNLEGGTYYVTVIDLKGCSRTLSKTLNDPSNMILTETHQNVVCNGDNTGSIDLTVGGEYLQPLVYSWVGPDNFTSNSEDIYNLYPGLYTVTVTEGNGCTKTLSVNITASIAIDVVANITDVSCNSYSDGSIELNVIGEGPFTYNWTGPNNFSSSNKDIYNLISGFYNVTISNSICNLHKTYHVKQPESLSITSQLSYNGCSITSTANINITVSGGNPPYSYQWSNGQTSEDLLNVSGGTYTVTIIDSKNCPSLTYSVSVQQAPPISIVNSMKKDVSCKNYCNGYIDIDVIGGAPPLNYHWKYYKADIHYYTQDIYDLCKGWYYLTITDNRGCKVVRSFAINEPSALSVNFISVSNPTGNGLCNGKILANGSGGTYPYAYIWSGPSCPCFTNYIKNLCPGTYTVTVTDFNGCTATASKTIIVSTKNYFNINYFDETEENNYTLSLDEFENQYYKIYPNPVQDKLYVELYDKIDKIELVDILGKIIYTINSEATNDKIVINTDNYNNGIYYLILYKRNNIYRHVINIRNN